MKSFIKVFIDHILSDNIKIKPGSISILTPYKNQRRYLDDVFSDYSYNTNATKVKKGTAGHSDY